MRIAIDIGGTFTDVVAYDDETDSLTAAKALTTPRDLIAGVFDAVRAGGIESSDVELATHGSTVVVNALIERKGARTALLTTKGFRDVYEIGRINRPDAFNVAFTRHRPLIERDLIFEVEERISAEGEELIPLDVDALRGLARHLRAIGVESIAVVLLHAYRNSKHELEVGQLLRSELPGCFISLSHEISREYREFERTSTVAANAFVGPIVSEYLDRLGTAFSERRSAGVLAVMQSNGGVTDVASARTQCVQMLESGPAGGVVGTIAVCRSLGYDRAIAFDMGGTTAKSAVIRDLTMPLASDYFLGGYATGLPIRIPCIDIVEVGTGGGSVAWVDDAGGVHVGPASAGAEPGPACYGRGGTDPTITDATVALGQLSAGGELFGGLRLDGRMADAAISGLAERLGIDRISAATGILSIAAASMANSVRAVTTERGLDPRDFALFAYGGNGPLHVSLVARELGIRDVVIPQMPAVFSAVGMLMADLRRDVVETRVRRVDHQALDEVETAFRSLEAECEAAMQAGDIRFDGLTFERAADMRYVGQEHTVTVHLPVGPITADQLKALFDSAHQQRYSHSAPLQPAELVSLRASAIGHLAPPGQNRIGEGSGSPRPEALSGSREIVFSPAEGALLTPVFRRSHLLAGNQIAGPAVIEESTATTLLRPGDTALVDLSGNLLLTIGAPV